MLIRKEKSTQYRTCPEKPTLLNCFNSYALFWEKKLRGQHLPLVQNKESTDLPKGSSSALLSVTQHIMRGALQDHAPGAIPPAAPAVLRPLPTAGISLGTPRMDAAEEHRFTLRLQQCLQRNPLVVLKMFWMPWKWKQKMFLSLRLLLFVTRWICTSLYLHVFILSVSLILMRSQSYNCILEYFSWKKGGWTRGFVLNWAQSGTFKSYAALKRQHKAGPRGEESESGSKSGQRELLGSFFPGDRPGPAQNHWQVRQISGHISQQRVGMASEDHLSNCTLPSLDPFCKLLSCQRYYKESSLMVRN